MLAPDPILGEKRGRIAEQHSTMSEEQLPLQCTPDIIQTVTIDDCATHTLPANNSQRVELTNKQVEAK